MERFFRTICSALVLALCAVACTPVDQTTSFEHGIETGPQPWTHENFDADDEKFTFAVFSDLTGGERDKVFEIAVAQLNLLRPELIINVGDLIDGGTEDLGEIAAQWDSFDERAERATAPVFYVGGNHDLTDIISYPLGHGWLQKNGFLIAEIGAAITGAVSRRQFLGHV